MDYKLSFKRTTNRYTKQDLFKNIEATWNFHKRQPTINEMNIHPSTICFSTYYNHFGSWTKAITEFVKSKNNGKVVKEKPEDIQKEKRKSLSLSLRFEIMKRDNFKCVLCGKSPANNHGTTLEVDHITPISRGGKTKTKNLQTLCKICNSGKKDK